MLPMTSTPAGVVVQVDAPGEVGRDPAAVLVLAEAEHVVEPVVADDRAARGDPVAAPGVDGARVLGLQVHVADVVVLDHQVVAAEHDAHAGAVVDQVVRGAVAHAVERDPHALLVEHADVVDVVVLGDVLGRSERDAVAAAEGDPVRADVGDVVADDPVVPALVDARLRRGGSRRRRGSCSRRPCSGRPGAARRPRPCTTSSVNPRSVR